MKYTVYRDGVLYIYKEGGGKVFSADDVSGSGGIIILADLTHCGLEIIHNLDSWSLLYKVTAVKLDIYTIECGGAVFKNSHLFGISLDGGYQDVWSQYTDVRVLIHRVTGGSIHERRVCSLASIGAAALKKFCRRALVSESEGYASIFRGCFFGGRRQDFIAHVGDGWCFDFKSMYGNILKLSYPLNYFLVDGMHDIRVPGFYYAEFCYSGCLLAPRLPVRNKHSVTYERGGVGWYWHEELEEFKACGGTITCLGSAIHVSDGDTHLKDLSDFLMLQRSLGLKCAKAVLNSLYGRLAINPTNKRTVVRKVTDCGSLHDHPAYVKHKNFIMFEVEGSLTGKRVLGNMCWANIISSRGRTQLMRLIWESENAGYRVVSVNTDCIWIDSLSEPKLAGCNLMQSPVFFKSRYTK